MDEQEDICDGCKHPYSAHDDADGCFACHQRFKLRSDMPGECWLWEQFRSEHV